MENHHHCRICGNMISPSKQICTSCDERRPRLKLNPALEEAIEEFLDKQARKAKAWKGPL